MILGVLTSSVKDPTASNAGNDINHPEDPLWELYNEKTSEQDKNLVDDWKSDMDGILLFVGILLPPFHSASHLTVLF
jgi:hypothetical protein